jgi:hypothetical protein
MTNYAVFCIASSEAQAMRIVNNLRSAGFSEGDISVLLPKTMGDSQIAHEAHTKAPEGGMIGVGTGGVAGGILGLLAGIGALAIPGLGPLIAAGPILATLSGAAAGAAVGGIAGGLIGLGIPEVEAKLYESRIREGNILITAHVGDNDALLERAKDIFEAEGATDIHTVSPKTAGKQEQRPRDTRS